ncbi:MAG: NAD(P)-dependent oxidoreductase [Chloroflexi bacterium]|nr:NAD(P)-dependent oxidoreductase [Chloroflexota bacterium]
MRVFLTGGDGFLGQYVMAALRAAGHDITALAGEPTSPHRLRALGAARVVPGRLEKPEPWLAALAGHDAVVHLAAPVKVWGPWSLFREQIVTATQRLFQAARQHNVRRFLYASSETVHWGEDVTSLVGIDEDARFARHPYAGYSRAKQAVERYLQAAAPHPTASVILRLPFLWGPGSKFLDELATQARRGRLLWLGDPAMPIEAAHVVNAAHAVVLALERGRGRRAYFVTDQHDHTLGAFFRGLLRALRLPEPTRRVPVRGLRAWTRLAEGLWRGLRLPGKPFPMTRFELAFFTLPRRYRTARSQHELGYRAVVSWEAGLAGLAAGA